MRDRCSFMADAQRSWRTKCPDANTVLDLKYLETVLGQARDGHLYRREMLAKYGEDNVHKDQ